MSTSKERIYYTIMHRRALKAISKVYCPKEYQDEIDKRLIYHDMDKVIMNLIDIPYEEVKKIHRLNSRHHYIPNTTYTKADYLEMIFDWESARYTKDDKPANAYNTLIKYYEPLIKEIKPILEEIHLDTEDDTKNEEVTKLIDYNLTDEDIKKEITNYLNIMLLKTGIK